MFKLFVVLFAVIACAAAKPWVGEHLAYTAPAALVAASAPVITATSNQVIARNHNGIVSAPVIAPVATPVIARTIAAAPLAYSSHLISASPLTYTAAHGPILW